MRLRKSLMIAGAFVGVLGTSYVLWCMVAARYLACQEIGRALTDRELIDRVLEERIASGELALTNSDQTPENYFENHPYCCAVERSDHREVLDRVLVGPCRVIGVSLIYEMSAPLKETRQARFYAETRVVDGCGRELYREYAETINGSEFTQRIALRKNTSHDK